MGAEHFVGRGDAVGRLAAVLAGRGEARPDARLLVYYRTYVPHALLGFLFGIDDSNVSRGNRRLEPLPAGVFRTPERKAVLAREGIAELFFDSTGRPTCRPVRGQKRYYSGKKRRHTLKVQVVAVRVRKRPGRGRDRRRVRVAVEHAIGKMKVRRVAAERWRNPRRRHTLVMKNVTGMHNRMFAE